MILFLKQLLLQNLFQFYLEYAYVNWGILLIDEPKLFLKSNQIALKNCIEDMIKKVTLIVTVSPGTWKSIVAIKRLFGWSPHYKKKLKIREYQYPEDFSANQEWKRIPQILK